MIINMLLSPHTSEAEWNARYLMALSHLNFDHELTLIIMPNALSNCTWNNKQWQALTLYGLSGCYHFNEAPPINSTPLGWKEARQLISSNHPVLHICHWQGLNHFLSWLPMAAADDCLVVIDSLNDTETNNIDQFWPNKNHHIVNSTTQPHIPSQETSLISHKRWAQLLQQYQYSLTWN